MRVAVPKWLQWTGLVSLAIVVAFLVALAVRHVQARPAGVTATVASPSAAATPDGMASASPEPTTSQATTASSGAGLAAVNYALSGGQEASILVLGDGSGDEAEEWVGDWARQYLSKEFSVKYRAWQSGSGAYGKAVDSGSGPTLTVWNGSHPSPAMATEVAWLNKVWHPANVVVLSYGHSLPASTIAADLTRLRKAAMTKSSAAVVLVMIQNPDRTATEKGQRSTTKAVKAWAEKSAVPSIDVYQAFLADPAPRNQLVKVDGSPTAAGSKLWAETVAAALGQAE